jgi:hypothetical protein
MLDENANCRAWKNYEKLSKAEISAKLENIPVVLLIMKKKSVLEWDSGFFQLGRTLRSLTL